MLGVNLVVLIVTWLFAAYGVSIVAWHRLHRAKRRRMADFVWIAIGIFLNGFFVIGPLLARNWLIVLLFGIPVWLSCAAYLRWRSLPG